MIIRHDGRIYKAFTTSMEFDGILANPKEEVLEDALDCLIEMHDDFDAIYNEDTIFYGLGRTEYVTRGANGEDITVTYVYDVAREVTAIECGYGGVPIDGKPLELKITDGTVTAPCLDGHRESIGECLEHCTSCYTRAEHYLTTDNEEVKASDMELKELKEKIMDGTLVPVRRED
jgi:hypothetical protein